MFTLGSEASMACIVAKHYVECRARKVQDAKNADARLYHKDMSTLSVKVKPSFMSVTCNEPTWSTAKHSIGIV